MSNTQLDPISVGFIYKKNKMKLKKIYWQEPDSLEIIKKELRDDKIIICSTDTVLGLLGNCTQKAFLLLNEIKVRENKPYIILIESKKKALKFVDESSLMKASKLIDTCWPGPLTLIFNAKQEIYDFIKGSDGRIALRVPNHEGLLHLLSYFDGLFSTSANVAGKKVPENADQIDQTILAKVSYIVLDKPTGIMPSSLPSTLLDCSSDRIKVIREGALSIDELEQIQGERFSR
jgi:L-threonylcarbamoyladenylate synthase